MEQRYAIAFMLRQKMNSKDIVSKLNEVYQEECLCDSQIYYWISEIRFGRKDLSNQKSTGRPYDENIDDFILRQLEKDPHTTARMIARKSGNALSTILSHLKNSLHRKCLHLKWIPHSLNSAQKRKRALLSNSLLQQLDIASKNNFLFVLTGDESWFEFNYTPKRMWVLDSSFCDEIVAKSHFVKKIMVTIFFNGDGLQLLDIKPPGIKINGSYFLNNIIIPLENCEIVQHGIKQKQKIFIHYDNSPVHTSGLVKQHLESSKLTIMEHPPYSPDLAPSDFGLFGTMKSSFTGNEFETENELIEAITNFFKQKPKEFWISLFNEWQKRLRRCIEVHGNYFD